MSVQVIIFDGALPAELVFKSVRGNERDCESGAALVFDGIVRRMESGKPLKGLLYEAYEPMASRILENLAQGIVTKHGLHSLGVAHSKGLVLVGQRSLRVEIRAAHRTEALAAMSEFIDALKRDVPIWKTAEWE